MQHKWFRWGIVGLAAAFILYHILFISDFLVRFTDFAPTPNLHLAIHLGGVLFFLFLLMRASKKIKSELPPLYDIFLAFLGLGVCLYYGIFFEDIFSHSGTGVVAYSILGYILAILLLEGSRRAVGLPFVIVVAFFAIYPLISGYFPSFLFHPNFSYGRWGEFLFASGQSIFGPIIEISATIVVVFLLFSQVLVNTRAGDFFINLAYSIFGTIRGGPAKMCVVASGLFGTLSGSVLGNAMATGTFTIPLMKKIGYKPHYAAAVEAVSSVGGILMPPVMGAAIFLLCDFINVPYIEVCKAAAIPAVLYYVAIFVMVDQEALKQGLKGLPRESLPPFWKTLKQGLWYAVPVIVLLYMMIGPQYSPQKSVIWAIVVLLIMSVIFWKQSHITPRTLLKSSEETLRSLLLVAVAIGAAGIIYGSVAMTNLGTNLSRELVAMCGGNLILLLFVTAVVAFVLGMGIGILPIYVFLALGIAPGLVSLGAPPLAAHLFVFYWAMISFITPPVAMSAYVTAAIAGANPFQTGWQATRLGILVYLVPFAFVLKPALLTLGTPLEVVIAIVCVTLATIGLSLGIGGYFLGRMHWIQRAIIIAGSGLLMFATIPLYLALGAVLAVIIIAWQTIKKRLVVSKMKEEY